MPFRYVADRVEPVRARSNGAQTLEKGLALLNRLAVAPEPQRLSALARGTRLPPSTVHRLLAALVAGGYVERDAESGRYRLGPQAVAFSATILQNLDLTREAPPVLREFTRRTGESITLAMLDDWEVVSLCRCAVDGRPGLFVHLGHRAPAHSTALGKVLLAALPDAAVLRVLKRRGMPALTPRTITSLERFLEHLCLVRTRGYAVDDEETVPGARCLAVPVRNHHGETVAALSASGSVIVWTRGRMRAVRAALAEAGRALSLRLGYEQPPVQPAGMRKEGA